MNQQYRLHPIKRILVSKKVLAISFFIFAIAFTNLLVKAAEGQLEQAQIAMKNKHYQRAKELFTELRKQGDLKTQASFGLAKLAFFQDQLDIAEDYISEVLDAAPDNPEHLFIAARIAGKQAQSASIFTKLGYARDAKKYFTQALKVDRHHKPSLIGLIRFHQQAPVMAGGDKEVIPDLIDRLRELDKRVSFSIQAPYLFESKKIEKAFKLYNEALDPKVSSDTDIGDFKFEFAMLLSNQGLYQPALKELLSIDLSNESEQPEYANMRLYQIGKLSAESKSNFPQGIASISEYASLPADDKTIPNDWVDFRLAQLNYLSEKTQSNQHALEKISEKTSNKDLKSKIRSFLKSN